MTLVAASSPVMVRRARWLPCPRDRTGQRVALLAPAGHCLLRPPPRSPGVVAESRAWVEESALTLRGRVISSSVTLGKATCETAFMSHRKKARLPKFCLSQEEMLKS